MSESLNDDSIRTWETRRIRKWSDDVDLWWSIFTVTLISQPHPVKRFVRGGYAPKLPLEDETHFGIPRMKFIHPLGCTAEHARFFLFSPNGTRSSRRWGGAAEPLTCFIPQVVGVVGEGSENRDKKKEKKRTRKRVAKLSHFLLCQDVRGRLNWGKPPLYL